MLVAKNQIQFNGSHALAMLTNALRYNSFEGCKAPGMQQLNSSFGNVQQSIPSLLVGGATTEFPIADPTNNSLLGYDVDNNGDLQPPPPAIVTSALEALSVRPRKNSSVLLSYNVRPASMPISSAMTNNTADINIASNALGLGLNDYALITNCLNASVFRVLNTPTTTIKHEGFVTRYGADAQIHQVEYNIFFVADTNRKDLMGKPIYALYLSQNGDLQELAEGVMALKVEYQSLQNGEVQYLPPNHASLDMSQVRTVQVGLLVSSVATPLPELDTRNYQLLSQTLSPTGTTDLDGELESRNLKQVFSTAVTLRNRG
jgi:type IV pilus assembly protein PilW